MLLRERSPTPETHLEPAGPQEPAAPTLYIRASRWHLWALLVWLGIILGVIGRFWFDHGASALLIVAGAVVVGLLGRCLWMLRDRLPQMVVTSKGVELPPLHTGLIRWHKITHLEFTPGVRRHEGYITIFYVRESNQPKPRASQRITPLAFAGTEPLADHEYVSINATILEHTPKLIFAELEARRSGGTGPLTQKLFRNRR